MLLWKNELAQAKIYASTSAVADLFELLQQLYKKFVGLLEPQFDENELAWIDIQILVDGVRPSDPC